MKDQQESKVGKKLSDMTTRRVVVLVLAMLFSVPGFTVSTYLTEPNSFDYGLKLIKELGPTTKGGKAVFESVWKSQMVLPYTPLIQLYVNPDDTIDNNPNILEWRQNDKDGKEINVKDLRSDEKEIAVLFDDSENPSGKDHSIYLAVYDLRQVVVL